MFDSLQTGLGCMGYMYNNFNSFIYLIDPTSDRCPKLLTITNRIKNNTTILYSAITFTCSFVITKVILH